MWPQENVKKITRIMLDFEEKEEGDALQGIPGSQISTGLLFSF